MRSEPFRKREHNRYWWFRISGADYVPPVFSALSNDEWAILSEWYEDSELKFPSPGEISIPGISMLCGIIGGNAISSVVQCGHYVGFSTLVLGFLMRRMGKRTCIFSVDIDPVATDYTRAWLEKAGLQDQVKLVVDDSANPALTKAAESYFGRRPELVFIDSSHQYSHTLKELDVWHQGLSDGGLIALHDVSVFAKQFDSTGLGGVLPAATEWSQRNGASIILLNSFVDGQSKYSGDSLVYKDGCGFGLIQKRA